ncbi:hypothetical protein GN156_05045 [bacterium LRH843]|nr:hypothetical protein [bacterium LRH843]
MTTLIKDKEGKGIENQIAEVCLALEENSNKELEYGIYLFLTNGETIRVYEYGRQSFLEAYNYAKTVVADDLNVPLVIAVETDKYRQFNF